MKKKEAVTEVKESCQASDLVEMELKNRKTMHEVM